MCLFANVFLFRSFIEYNKFYGGEKTDQYSFFTTTNIRYYSIIINLLHRFAVILFVQNDGTPVLSFYSFAPCNRMRNRKFVFLPPMSTSPTDMTLVNSAKHDINLMFIEISCTICNANKPNVECAWTLQRRVQSSRRV